MRNEIYIVHTKYGPAAMSFMEGSPEQHFYSFCPKGKFVPWLKDMIEKFPEFKLRCVKNEGITEWLEARKQQKDIFALEYKANLSRD